RPLLHHASVRLRLERPLRSSCTPHFFEISLLRASVFRRVVPEGGCHRQITFPSGRRYRSRKQIAITATAHGHERLTSTRSNSISRCSRLIATSLASPTLSTNGVKNFCR